MFEQAPDWISRSPRIRKMVVKIWRMFLRVQRATLAKAVLVARRRDDCVFAVASPSGELRLPSLELDGWKPVTKQVQAWIERILRQSGELRLQLVDGTPGKEGVTFLYSVEVREPSRETQDTWLEAELAPSALPEGDRRLLLMSQLR
jgi:hypothetical protein